MLEMVIFNNNNICELTARHFGLINYQYTAPLVGNLGSRWKLVVSFMSRQLYPRERTPVLTEQVVWARETDRTFWSRKISSPAGNRNPELPVRGLVTGPTTLSRFQNGITSPLKLVHCYSNGREVDEPAWPWKELLPARAVVFCSVLVQDWSSHISDCYPSPFQARLFHKGCRVAALPEIWRKTEYLNKSFR